jgi:hypothetical protein
MESTAAAPFRAISDAQLSLQRRHRLSPAALDDVVEKRASGGRLDSQGEKESFPP